MEKGKAQILLKLCAQYLSPQFPSWSTHDKKAFKTKHNKLVILLLYQTDDAN